MCHARRVIRALSAAAVVLACSVAAGSARAQSATLVDLMVDVPDGALECLRSATLREAVQVRMSEEDRTEPVAVAITAAPIEDGRWQVRIGLAAADGAIGVRELSIDDADCVAVADAIALVVVLALRGPTERVEPMRPEELPVAAGRALGRPPIPADEPDPGPEDPAPLPVHPARVPPTDPPPEVVREADGGEDGTWSWGLLVGVGARAGMLPAISPTGTLSLTVKPPGPSRLIVSGLLALPQREKVAEGEVRLFHAEIRAAACVTLVTLGDTVLDGCGVAAAGLLWARARGFAVWNGSATQPTLDVGLAGRVGHALGRGGRLFLSAEADLAVLRPVFFVTTSSDRQLDAHQPSVGSLLVTAGLGVDFE